MELKQLLCLSLLYYFCEGKAKKAYGLKWEQQKLTKGRIDIHQQNNVVALVWLRNINNKRLGTLIAVSTYEEHHFCNAACCVLKFDRVRISCIKKGHYIILRANRYRRRYLPQTALIAIYSNRPALVTSSQLNDNLALKKKVTGSMPFDPVRKRPGNIVNGLEDMSTNIASLRRCPFAATLYADPDLWWLIDLGRKCEVYGVGLMHSILHGTPHDTIIEVFSESPEEKPNSERSVCIRLSGYLQFKIKINCQQRIIGRYVRLKKERMDYPTDTFALCEVQVYGSIFPEDNQHVTSTDLSVLSTKGPKPLSALETDAKLEATSKPTPTITVRQDEPIIATNISGPTIGTPKGRPTIATNSLGPTIAAKKPKPTIATIERRSTIVTTKPGPTIGTHNPGPSRAANRIGPAKDANERRPNTCVPSEHDKDTMNTHFVPRTIKEMLSCIKQFKKCIVLGVLKPDNPSCLCECLSLKSGVPLKVELMFEKLMENCSITK